MTRTELANWCLAASAFVLVALICVRVGALADNSAKAEMVVTSGTVTMLSTQGNRPDQEIVYVLDSQQRMLNAYELDPNRGIFQLLGQLDIGATFDRYMAGGAEQPAAAPGAGPRRPR
jgi:hypothetical protein